MDTGGWRGGWHGGQGSGMYSLSSSGRIANARIAMDVARECRIILEGGAGEDHNALSALRELCHAYPTGEDD